MDDKHYAAEIDNYIAQAAPEAQTIMRALRAVIHEEVPEATEKISWGMATFVYHGNLIHFAAFARHVGLYPGPAAVEHFHERLAVYKTSKGAVQLPLDAEVPLDLVREIVRFGAKENLAIEAARAAKRKEKRAER